MFWLSWLRRTTTAAGVAYIAAVTVKTVSMKRVSIKFTRNTFYLPPGHTPSSSKLLKVAQTNPSRRHKRLLRNLLGAVRAALGTSLARGRLEREEATRRRPRPARFRLRGLKFDRRNQN